MHTWSCPASSGLWHHKEDEYSTFIVTVLHRVHAHIEVEFFCVDFRRHHKFTTNLNTKRSCSQSQKGYAWSTLWTSCVTFRLGWVVTIITLPIHKLHLCLYNIKIQQCTWHTFHRYNTLWALPLSIVNDNLQLNLRNLVLMALSVEQNMWHIRENPTCLYFHQLCYMYMEVTLILITLFFWDITLSVQAHLHVNY